ncbi:unnamed protein product [Prorocentrum cordatum]|uniref:Uncharacterized protein n=1 Tax=Prorocentrum cordatum TaxID=2364126 RepID=A0ABN9RW92_9DINO|nr:unnamed protein product [Polarella glacialis]
MPPARKGPSSGSRWVAKGSAEAAEAKERASVEKAADEGGGSAPAGVSGVWREPRRGKDQRSWGEDDHWSWQEDYGQEASRGGGRQRPRAEHPRGVGNPGSWGEGDSSSWRGARPSKEPSYGRDAWESDWRRPGGRENRRRQEADDHYWAEDEVERVLSSLLGKWKDGAADKQPSEYEVTHCVLGKSLTVETWRPDGRTLFTKGLIRKSQLGDRWVIAWGRDGADPTFVLSTSSGSSGSHRTRARWVAPEGTKRPFEWVRDPLEEASPGVASEGDPALPSRSSREPGANQAHGAGLGGEDAASPPAKSWASVVRGADRPLTALAGPAGRPDRPISIFSFLFF